MLQDSKFGVADFIIFFGMLLFSLGIGLFYAFKDRKKNSMDNYYFGGRNMSPITVGLSLALSLISSIAVLGYPNHAYVFGSVVVWFGVSTTVQVVIACMYYIPLYHRLQLTSVYKYLELRFNVGLRKLVSVGGIFSMTFFMGVTVYLTALALNTLTPLGIEWNIIIATSISTLYTSLGGMKAVVWSDTMQAIVMVAGSVAVLIKTTMAVGGFGNITEALERGERNTVWNFNPDPHVTHTFWTIFVGLGLTNTHTACTTQLFTQRYAACKTPNAARVALIIAAIPMALPLILPALNGLAMYTYFEGCDPFTQGRIDNIDQTVALLVGEIFENTPGMAGLFVSTAYSGMLSTLSSGINSVSALILEDFISVWKPNMTQRHRITISKCLGVGLGTAVAALAFLNQILGATVVQIAQTVVGLFAGPSLGVYTVGVFFPWTNSIGATAGLISSFCVSVWITVGGFIYGPNPVKNMRLPLSIDNCTYATTIDPYGGNVSEVPIAWTSLVTNTSTYTSAIEHNRPVIADTLYSLSYLYIGSIGFLISLLVAIPLSFATGKNDPKKMDPRLFVPFVDNPCLPRKVRNFFRFGVPEITEDIETKETRL